MIYDGLLDHNKVLEMLLKYCAIIVQELCKGIMQEKTSFFPTFLLWLT